MMSNNAESPILVRKIVLKVVSCAAKAEILYLKRAAPCFKLEDRLTTSMSAPRHGILSSGR